jgi:hypothetical protein
MGAHNGRVARSQIDLVEYASTPTWYSRCVALGVFAVVVQMLMTSIAFGVGVDVYNRVNAKYPELLETSKQVGEIIAGINTEYHKMDKSAVHAILKNTKNVTYTANMLVQDHGIDIVNDAHKVSKLAAANSVVIDTVGQAIELIRDPVSEIHKLITHNNSINLQTALAQADRVLGKVDAIELNRLITVVIQFLQKINDGMNPTTIQELKYIAEKFNDFSSESNQKVIDHIVHDTDESMKNLNHIIEIFSNVKK